MQDYRTLAASPVTLPMKHASAVWTGTAKFIILCVTRTCMVKNKIKINQFLRSKNILTTNVKINILKSIIIIII